jgi:hypothetical protein
MDEFYKKISKESFYAMIAIIVLLLIYQFSPKIGIALFLLIGLVAFANLYSAGVIKPPKEV